MYEGVGGDALLWPGSWEWEREICLAELPQLSRKSSAPVTWPSGPRTRSTVAASGSVADASHIGSVPCFLATATSVDS